MSNEPDKHSSKRTPKKVHRIREASRNTRRQGHGQGQRDRDRLNAEDARRTRKARSDLAARLAREEAALLQKLGFASVDEALQELGFTSVGAALEKLGPASLDAALRKVGCAPLDTAMDAFRQPDGAYRLLPDRRSQRRFAALLELLDVRRRRHDMWDDARGGRVAYDTRRLLAAHVGRSAGQKVRAERKRQQQRTVLQKLADEVIPNQSIGFAAFRIEWMLGQRHLHGPKRRTILARLKDGTIRYQARPKK